MPGFSNALPNPVALPARSSVDGEASSAPHRPECVLEGLAFARNTPEAADRWNHMSLLTPKRRRRYIRRNVCHDTRCPSTRQERGTSTLTRCPMCDTHNPGVSGLGGRGATEWPPGNRSIHPWTALAHSPSFIHRSNAPRRLSASAEAVLVPHEDAHRLGRQGPGASPPAGLSPAMPWADEPRLRRAWSDRSAASVDRPVARWRHLNGATAQRERCAHAVHDAGQTLRRERGRCENGNAEQDSHAPSNNAILPTAMRCASHHDVRAHRLPSSTLTTATTSRHAVHIAARSHARAA